MSAEVGGVTHRIGKLKQAVFVAMVTVVIGVVVALAAEGTVRVRQWALHGDLWSVEQTFAIDAVTGLRVPIPNAVIGNIRINSRGFRSPEVESPKPPQTVRLAFLGGSTTYCAEVSGNEMTWPHLVWQQTQAAHPRTRFDYINAGVPGYGVTHLLKSLELRVAPLQPDVVVIYEATNDLAADSREMAQRQGLVGARVNEESWPAKYSLLWSLTEKNLRMGALQAQATTEARRLAYDPHQLSRGFEDRLRALIAASREVAPVVAIATFSARVRREQPAEARREAAVTALYYMPYMSLDGLVDGYEEYNRVIRVVAKEAGAVLIEGEYRIPADSVHYNDSVHFRDAGSRLMAGRVSEALLNSPGFMRLLGGAAAEKRSRPRVPAAWGSPSTKRVTRAESLLDPELVSGGARSHNRQGSVAGRSNQSR